MKIIRCLFVVGLIMVIATGAIAANTKHGISPPTGEHYAFNCVTAWSQFNGEIALVVERFLSPRLEHDVDLFLEDLAVELVVSALIRHGRPAAEFLAQHVGPAGLVAAREADEAAPLGDMVESRGFFGDADRIVDRHDIAQAADVQPLRQTGPVAGVHADRARTQVLA